MMRIYQVDNGYLAGHADLAPGEQIPAGWTYRAPPALLEGQYAMWVGEWAVTDVAPLPPEPHHDPETERIFLRGQTWEILPIEPPAEPTPGEAAQETP